MRTSAIPRRRASRARSGSPGAVQASLARRCAAHSSGTSTPSTSAIARDGERHQVRRVRPPRGTASASGTARRSRPAAGRAARRPAARAGPAAFLNVTVPANDRYQPRSTQLAGHRRVPGEAVEDRALGRALLGEHPQHVVVRVAVVDLQRLAGAAWPGRCAGGTTPPARPRPSGAGAEVVEAGLADDADPRVAGQRARSRRAPRRAVAALGQPRRLVRVQRHAADAARRWLVEQRDRPARARRSQPICTIRVTPTGRRRQRRSPSSTGSAPRRRGGRCRGGCGCRRPGAAAARAPAGGRALGSRPAALAVEPGQLLLDHRRVELAEDRRRRRPTGVPGTTGTRLPRGGPPRVVAGEDRVARAAVEVVDLADLAACGDDVPVPPSSLVHGLRAVRQERRRAACGSR